MVKIKDFRWTNTYGKCVSYILYFRFINGNEVRKRAVFWGLRVRVPPPRTHIKLPVDGLVDDEVMKKLKVKGRRSKVFVPVPWYVYRLFDSRF